MVTFKLIKRTDTVIQYEYIPENDKAKKAGIIEIDIKADSVGVIQVAEEDIYINTNQYKYYWYATHAIDKICEKYNRGVILEEGYAMWY